MTDIPVTEDVRKLARKIVAAEMSGRGYIRDAEDTLAGKRDNYMQVAIARAAIFAALGLPPLSDCDCGEGCCVDPVNCPVDGNRAILADREARGDAIRSALAAGRGEPVAWRWKWKTTGSPLERRFADPDLYAWTYRDCPPSEEMAAKMIIEPLYAAPAPAQPVAIKPLEWKEGDYLYAYVTPRVPTGYCVGHEDGCYWLTLDGVNVLIEANFGSASEAQAAAQADYETRIRSALIDPPQPVDVDAIIDQAEDRFKLWFFRELSDAQRNSLFAIFGMPPLATHGEQATGLRAIIRALKGGA